MTVGLDGPKFDLDVPKRYYSGAASQVKDTVLSQPFWQIALVHIPEINEHGFGGAWARYVDRVQEEGMPIFMTGTILWWLDEGAEVYHKGWDAKCEQDAAEFRAVVQAVENDPLLLSEWQGRGTVIAVEIAGTWYLCSPTAAGWREVPASTRAGSKAWEFVGPRSALDGTMPWTGTYSARPWKGKFGQFSYGSAHSGHGVSTFLSQDGTLHIKWVVATNTELIAKRGMDGGKLLDLAIKYHGRHNIKRITAEFGDFRISGSFRRPPIDGSKNWQFFQRHRGPLGDLGALRKSPSVQALMRNGFTDIEILSIGDDFVVFVLKRPG